MDKISIKNIQRLLGQAEDGILGPQTVEAILSIAIAIVEEVELDQFYLPTEMFGDLKRLAERVQDLL